MLDSSLGRLGFDTSHSWTDGPTALASNVPVGLQASIAPAGTPGSSPSRLPVGSGAGVRHQELDSKGGLDLRGALVANGPIGIVVTRPG